MKLEIFSCRTTDPLYRRFIAQELFNRRGHQLQVALQKAELIGVIQKAEQAVANEVGGGLMPSKNQGDTVGDQVVIRKIGFLGLELQKVAHQALSRFGPETLQDLAEIRPSRSHSVEVVDGRGMVVRGKVDGLDRVGRQVE